MYSVYRSELCFVQSQNVPSQRRTLSWSQWRTTRSSLTTSPTIPTTTSIKRESNIFNKIFFKNFFLWCAYWQVLSVEISVVTELERTKSSNQSTVSILTNFFCNKTQPKPCLLLKSKPVLSEEQRAVHDCWVHKVHHHVHQPLKNSLKYPRQGSHAIITQIQLQTSNFWLWRQQPPTEMCRTQRSYYRMAKFKSAESL